MGAPFLRAVAKRWSSSSPHTAVVTMSRTSNESVAEEHRVTTNVNIVMNTNELTTAATSAAAPAAIPEVPKVDIEHVTVYDDPRQWSHTRKVSFFGRL